MQLPILDWLIDAVYFVLNFGIGFYYKARAGKSRDEFSLSGRQVKAPCVPMRRFRSGERTSCTVMSAAISDGLTGASHPPCGRLYPPSIGACTCANTIAIEGRKETRRPLPRGRVHQADTDRISLIAFCDSAGESTQLVAGLSLTANSER